MSLQDTLVSDPKIDKPLQAARLNVPKLIAGEDVPGKEVTRILKERIRYLNVMTWGVHLP